MHGGHGGFKQPPPTCPLSLCLPAAGASSGNAQPAASALDSSHLVAESPAMVEAASMAVHPFMSPHPSMPVSPAQVGGGAPSIAHLAGVMMQVGAGLPGCRCCRAILPCSSPCSAAVCSALHASAPQLRRPHRAPNPAPRCLVRCRATPARRWTRRRACFTTPPSTTSPSRA